MAKRYDSYDFRDAKPFKEAQGVEIRLMEDGRFIAKIGDGYVVRSSVSQIEREIRRQEEGVRVFAAEGLRSALYEYEIVEFAANGEARAKGRRSTLDYSESRSLYVYDDAIAAELEALRVRFERMETLLERQYKKVLARAKHVSKHNFREIQKASQKKGKDNGTT